MPDPNDYTVGWVSAVGTEYAAAQTFLDEEHGRPDFVAPHDENIYTLGKIGKHHVVIGILPYGEYGLSAASVVAKSMQHSFPNIRIGLMVGIGGGAPTKDHDIRLGDVVVSASSDGNSGVFQYDFGKTIQDQVFRTTGFLNQPPGLLRAAVADIRAQHELNGHSIEAMINQALDRKPRLRKEYARPDPTSDRLFQSTITHSSAEGASCITHCNVNSSNIIIRRKRGHGENDPAVHYGTIASANQLMKNAMIRDKLAAEKNVLCFEMEAAGLMNYFPCVIIRGICDYSDSHKNKDWQGYAAMTAAAYTKDLLSRIPQSKVESEGRINSLVSEVRDLSLGTDTKVRSMKSNLDRKDDVRVLDWLTAVDYGPRHSDILAGKQPGTGEWFLDSPEYRNWSNASNSTLFCPGIPGAGKTVLTALIIEDLCKRFQVSSNIGIAYIYCNFRSQEQQTVEHFLSSLLKQLAATQTSLPQSLKDLYHRHNKKRTRPLLHEIAAVLQDASALYSNYFIVVDALDECQATDGCREKFLHELFYLQSQSKGNMIFTSRFIPEITAHFKTCPRLEIHATDDDIRKYIDGRMSSLPDCLSTSGELQEEVKRRIVAAVSGMFLLAKLYLDSLKGKTTRKGIRRALENLESRSDTYENAYMDAMERINSQLPDHTELANKILMWIVTTKRPLTTTELQHALAVEEGDENLDEDNIPPIKSMVSVCAGLVTVDEESNIIRLVHHTTQEYFEKTRSDWFQGADGVIAKTSMTYLSFKVFESGFCTTDEDYEKRLNSFPLYDYAARHWGFHARMDISSENEVEETILHFFDKQQILEAAAQGAMVSLGPPGYSQVASRGVTGLHLAAYFGLLEIAMKLLFTGQKPDPIDTDNRTPLMLASANGHHEVVSLLLASDATNANSMDNHGRTALSWAAEKGHDKVLKQLLRKKDIVLNSKDEYQQTATSYAQANGHIEVVKMLTLTSQANSIPNDNSQGPLLLLNATRDKNESAVRSLLRHVQPNSMCDNGQTPLTLAATLGHESILKLMLSVHGILPNCPDGNGKTALSCAAENGHDSVFQLLLRTNKVDPDTTDAQGYTPLLYAAKNGHRSIVELLLAMPDVNPTAKDNAGRTSLFWALENWHKPILKLLLQYMVNPKAKASGGQLLSYFSCSADDVEAVETLFNKRSEDDTEHKMGRSILSYAAEQGFQSLVKLLYENGYAINAKNPTEISPLSYAIRNGHQKIVQFLIEKGAQQRKNGEDMHLAILSGHQTVVEVLLNINEIDYVTDTGRTFLMTATGCGRNDIVRLLLDRGAALDVADASSYTAILYAAKYGHATTIQLLLESGAQMNPLNTRGRTPLSCASRYGHKQAVELLLATAGDKNPNEYELIALDKTPLAAAAEYGHEDIFTILLERGSEKQNPLFWRVPLFLAATNGHQGIVKLLLQDDANENDRDARLKISQFIATKNEKKYLKQLMHEKYDSLLYYQYRFETGGQSALSVANKGGYSEIVRMLIENGAFVDSADTKGRKPVLVAAENNYPLLVEMLAKAGADIACVDKNGRTPLSVAASKGFETIVDILLEKGMGFGFWDIYRYNSGRGCAITPFWVKALRYPSVTRSILEKVVIKQLQTQSVGPYALLAATRFGDEICVQALIEAGANVNFADKHRRIPILLAAEHGHEKVLLLLIQAGADLEYKDRTGRTALSIAAMRGHKTSVKLLIDSGAFTSSYDINGKSPLSFAEEEGREEIVELFVQNDVWWE